MSCMRFVGKVALITGGGSGIGAATARRIVAEGGNVVITGRRPEPIRELAEALGGAWLAGDTTDFAHLQAAVQLAQDRFGGLDILVANAGSSLFGTVVNVDLDAWQQTWNVNVNGALLACRAAVPAMRARGGGAIVTVSSGAALKAAPGGTPYQTTKAALLALSRSMAVDFGPEGIRANVVIPALVRTEMAETGFGHKAKAMGVGREDLFEAIAAAYPLRRLGRPEEIAAAIAFLASDDASFITGTELLADGGSEIVNITSVVSVAPKSA